MPKTGSPLAKGGLLLIMMKEMEGGIVRMRSDTTTGENRYARAPLGATGHNHGEGRFIRAH